MHVLFKERDSSILANIQMSPVGSSPFALLRAANGALLAVIGRGMLTIGSVTVIAYLFRDSDLVHNLLGIGPFADLSCASTFIAERFTLHHHGKKPLLVATRHAGNLWKIALSRPRFLQAQYCCCTSHNSNQIAITCDSSMLLLAVPPLQRSCEQ